MLHESLLGLIISESMLGSLAHGSLRWPPSWFDPHGAVGMRTGFAQDSCSAGCGHELHQLEHNFHVDCSCMWYTQGTKIPGNATIPLNDPARTFFHQPTAITDRPIKLQPLNWHWVSKNPWSAPGTSPVDSPCGLMGGKVEKSTEAVKGLRKEGHFVWWDPKDGYGDNSIEREFPNAVTTEWVEGSVVDAAWGISAQHGGGYSYRLCKLPPEGRSGLTEECFQQHVLSFVGNTSWLQFGENVSHRRAIPALRVTNGTFPKGSMWSRNPIPSCAQHGGGDTCWHGPMFPPPIEGIYGFGDEHSDGFQFSIVDRLQIPSGLPQGDYVFSWRWDAEDGEQVWAQCANVRILPKNATPAVFEQPPLPSNITLLTRLKKGPYKTGEECQHWCTADFNCLAYEIGGCRFGHCRGPCFHFYRDRTDCTSTEESECYYKEADDKYQLLGSRGKIIQGNNQTTSWLQQKWGISTKRQ